MPNKIILILLVSLAFTFTSCSKKTTMYNNADFSAKMSRLIDKIEKNQTFRSKLFSINIHRGHNNGFQLIPQDSSFPLREVGQNGYLILVNDSDLDGERMEAFNDITLSKHYIGIDTLKVFDQNDSSMKHKKFNVYRLHLGSDPEVVKQVCQELLTWLNPSDQKLINYNVATE